MASHDYENEPQGAESFFELTIDKRTRRFLEVIEDFPNPTILEVGMGQGNFLKKISRQRADAQLYGIDISRAAIAAVREEDSFKGEFTIGDAQKLPFPTEFFDVVVIMDVLEHLNDPQKAILEAKRVLKPGGIFHFYFPCEGQPGTFDWFLRITNFLDLRDFTRIHFGHIQHFSQKEIKKIAMPHFSIATITYSTHWVSQVLHFLTLYLPKKLIGLFGGNIQKEIRDAYRPGKQQVAVIRPLTILKNAWLIFVVFPVSLIYEIEAKLLKHCSLGAQGLHFTCKK